MTALVDAAAETAFAFLSDPHALGRWSLGCFDTKSADETGLYAGVSLFDRTPGFCRIEPHPALNLVDYRIGTPERLVARISARVVPHHICDLRPDQCYVTLTAWRPATMKDERWERLCATHEAEIWLIKAQIETGGRRGG
ncbi:MAG TPA: hypothetical protein VFO41_15570 [Alphaproteobacteria bacterium]|nr:hypothetical protein [Alphaproteobacteria bacterium]